MIDRELKISHDSQLITSIDDGPVWAVCSTRAEPDRVKALEDQGVKVIQISHDHPDIIPATAIAEALAEEGLTRVLIEGGGRTITEFLKAALVDQLLWFRAPVLMGGDGVPAIQALGVENLADMARFAFEHSERHGDDFLDIWRRKA